MRPLDDFIALWTSKGVPLEFHDTINTPVPIDEFPATWGSARYDVETRTDVTLGSNPYVEERGVITVGLFARSGTGGTVLDNAISFIREHFHGYASADGKLYYTQVEGPFEIEDVGGEWWQVALAIPYVLQSTRAEPVP